MKRIVLLTVILAVWLFHFLVPVQAVWIWTPKTGKWINPKYSVKSNPAEQIEYAEGLFQNREYEKAIKAYRKLIKHYPRSVDVPKAQYAIGSAYESLKEYVKAVGEYQKVLDNYPSSDKIAEVVENQYRIGNILFGEEVEGKLKKVFVENNYEKAAKVYQLVIKNAPYHERAAEVQYRIGLCYREQSNFSQAVIEYRKVVETYPDSPWIEKAHYDIGVSYLSQSLSPLYDQTMTDSALKHLDEFRKRFPDSELNEKIVEKIALLKERKAERKYQIAQFYDKQGSPKAAGIYYREVVAEYPASSWAELARERLNVEE